jgi:ribosomal protein S18 acetylase RimI-like enzyme
MNKFEHTIETIIEFKKFNEISYKDMKQIKKIWKKSFDKKANDTIYLLEKTIIVTIKTKKKLNKDQEVKENIVAISFLLFPTVDLLTSNDDIYFNIKLQGVTENDCYLYNLCVKKRKRKNGYAKLILQKCHEYVTLLCKNKIILFVENGNIPAIHLYNNFGYNVHRSTPTGFIMEKNLP